MRYAHEIEVFQAGKTRDRSISHGRLQYKNEVGRGVKLI